MKRFVNRLIAALLSIGLCGTAHADLIDWTLNGVAFDDGGMASGMFRVDTVTRQITAWDITTTAGANLAGFHFTSSLPSTNFSNYGSNIFDVIDQATSNEIVLAFNSGFGTATSNNTINPGGTFEFETSTGNVRWGTAGSADGSLASSPGPLAGGGLLPHLIVGFVGLVTYRRKLLAGVKLSLAAGTARLRIHRVGYPAA